MEIVKLLTFLPPKICSDVTHCIYRAGNTAACIPTPCIQVDQSFLKKQKQKDKPGSLEAKGFCAMTSRRRMMSWRAENRTCRFRGVVEGQARGKP